jgi:V8-like Glu-specific endopeptidase
MTVGYSFRPDLTSSSDSHPPPRTSRELNGSVDPARGPMLTDDELSVPALWTLFHPVPESVCGEDRRQSIADTTEVPWRCICRLEVTVNDGRKGSATGFLIGPRCVITNGHVAFPNGDWAQEIKVVPALNGHIAPFGFAVSRKFRSTEGWTVNGDPNFDYGAVILPSNDLYSEVGTFLNYREHLSPGRLYLSGYPDLSMFPRGAQIFGSDSDVTGTSFGYRYTIDTSAGQSGSPLLCDDGGSLVCIGVHSVGQCPNFGIKCTPAVVRNWNQWRNL